MDVAGLLRLNIRRRAPGQVYVDCPICGDRRGKMNLNTAKDLWRCNYCGEGGGMLSLYAKVYGVSNSDAYREICDALAVNGFSPDYTVPEKTTPAEAEQSDAASVQEVHQTLSMLLSMLTLIPAHRAHLQSVRGLSDDEITRFGFKSTPPPFLCRSLTNRLVKAGCRVQGVPGFYVDDNGCWTVKFHQRTSGIIIPIFGVDGLIRGAQIRLDHPLKDKDDPPEKTGVKYLTLSSTGKRMGTTSGSPIHFVGDPCSRVVYVTEGCLKADVAHALMHRTFVATLGVNNTAKLDELFAFLHRNGTEEIIEAEDMDKYSIEASNDGCTLAAAYPYNPFLRKISPKNQLPCNQQPAADLFELVALAMLHNRFAHRQAQFDLLRRGIFQHACKFNRNTDVRMNRNVASKQSVKINAQCCRYIHQ